VDMLLEETGEVLPCKLAGIFDLIEKKEWEDREDYFFRTYLTNIWLTGRKKLYYLFDFGDKWTFEIRKGREGRSKRLVRTQSNIHGMKNERENGLPMESEAAPTAAD